MAFAFYSLLLPPEHWLRLLTAYCLKGNYNNKIKKIKKNAEQSSWGLPSSNINTRYEILRSVLYSGGHYSNGHSRVKLAQWTLGTKHLNPILPLWTSFNGDYFFEASNEPLLTRTIDFLPSIYSEPYGYCFETSPGSWL